MQQLRSAARRPGCWRRRACTTWRLASSPRSTSCLTSPSCRRSQDKDSTEAPTTRAERPSTPLLAEPLSGEPLRRAAAGWAPNLNRPPREPLRHPAQGCPPLPRGAPPLPDPLPIPTMTALVEERVSRPQDRGGPWERVALKAAPTCRRHRSPGQEGEHTQLPAAGCPTLP